MPVVIKRLSVCVCVCVCVSIRAGEQLAVVSAKAPVPLLAARCCAQPFVWELCEVSGDTTTSSSFFQRREVFREGGRDRKSVV